MKEFGSTFTYEILPDPSPRSGPAPRPPSPSSSAAQLSAECAKEGQAHLLGFGRQDFNGSNGSNGPTVAVTALSCGTNGAY